MAGFLDLPPELRLIIYIYYFDTTLPTLGLPTWQSKAHNLTNSTNRSKERIDLLHTSRLILRETLPIYHAALELHVLNIETFLKEVHCAMHMRVRPLDRLLRRKPLFFLRLMRSARLTEQSWSAWKRIEATVVLKKSGSEVQGGDRRRRGARVSLLDGVMREMKLLRELDRAGSI
jgi:hypothetical protein